MYERMVGGAIDSFRRPQPAPVHVSRRYFAGRVGPPKTRYGRRRLRLTPELARALWRLRADTRAGDDELVFTNLSGGRVDASNLMRDVLKPAAVEAGLGEWVRQGRKLRADSWVGFHTFRHTCATILFRRGWNAVQVQRWLGHHKPSFTLDTYVHLLDDDVPEPAFFNEFTAAGDQHGDHYEPKPAETPDAAEAGIPLASTGSAS
ncbi:MAG: tyrosine-type recombinase/integrase [Gaiellaceae bacterium]